MDLATETTGMAWAARVVCDAGSDAVSLLRAAIDAGSGAPDAENSDLVSREVVPVVMCIQNNGARYRGTTCSHVYTENSDLVSREVVPVVMCIQNTCMLACMHTLTHHACIHARGHASIHAFIHADSQLLTPQHTQVLSDAVTKAAARVHRWMPVEGLTGDSVRAMLSAHHLTVPSEASSPQQGVPVERGGLAESSEARSDAVRYVTRAEAHAAARAEDVLKNSSPAHRLKVAKELMQAGQSDDSLVRQV